MGEMCNDNRFEVIEKFKKQLIEHTNIETSADEMACLDSFLFRCWQMRWLEKIEKSTPKKPYYYDDGDYAECPKCGNDDFEYGINNWGCRYCPDCGQALDWS